MEKECIKLQTRKGEVSVMAYKATPNLYVHKHYRGNGEFSDKNYWSISHKSGYLIKAFRNTPMRLKEVILEVNKIAHLDWSMGKDFFNKISHEEKQKYFDAVREMHGF